MEALDCTTDLENFIGILMMKLGIRLELAVDIVRLLMGKVDKQKQFLDFLESKFHESGKVTEREVLDKIGELLYTQANNY